MPPSHSHPKLHRLLHAKASRIHILNAKIHPSLQEWEFKDFYDVNVGIKMIREVIIRDNSAKKAIQRIEYNLGDTVSDYVPPLKLIDSNSDGYLDLRILTVCGNEQCDERSWIFDRKASKFVYSKTLSSPKE